MKTTKQLVDELMEQSLKNIRIKVKNWIIDCEIDYELLNHALKTNSEEKEMIETLEKDEDKIINIFEEILKRAKK